MEKKPTKNSLLPSFDSLDPSIKGAFFKISSCLCFAAVNGIVRHLSLLSKQGVGVKISAAQLAFFESGIALLFILPWVISINKNSFKVHRPSLHFLRAIVSAIGMILWFTALSHMPILQVVAFKYTAPFFTVLGAKFILGEKVGWPRAIAIGTALIGAIFITSEEFLNGSLSFTDISALALLPLGSTICYASSGIFAKLALKEDNNSMTIFYLLLFSTPMLFLASIPQWVMPDMWQFFWIIGMGLCLAAAHYLLTHAYAVADLTFLVPMSFTRLIAAALIGIVFFNEWPSTTGYLGSTLILLSVILLCHFEIKKKKLTSHKKPINQEQIAA